MSKNQINKMSVAKFNERALKWNPNPNCNRCGGRGWFYSGNGPLQDFECRRPWFRKSK